jgi:hypothetical protein
MKPFLLICLVVTNQVSASVLFARNGTSNTLRNGSQVIAPASGNLVTSNATLSFNYKAFGDSFAAGIGAGKVFDRTPLELTCRKTTGGYPNVINQALHNQDLGFQDFVACSGATAEEVSKQIDDNMSNDIDIATVSLGYDLYECLLQQLVR